MFDLKPEEDVYWCAADVGWVTGHSYIVYGPLANGATSVMYEGAPDYPDKDIWWELVERYKVTLFYTRADRDPRVHEVGRRVPRAHDLSSLRLLGTVGEPINPKAWLWYWKVDRRRALPDRRHLVADRDRRDHDHDAPGPAGHQAGLGRDAAAGIEAAVVDEDGEDAGTEQGFLILSSARGRRCCGPSTRRTTASSRPTGTSSARTPTSSATPRAATRTATSGSSGASTTSINVSGHRLSTAEVESAIVSHEKVAEAAVIGQSDEDTGQAIAAFVTLEGDLEGDDELVAEIREHVAKRIGKLARPKRIIWADDLPKTRSGKIMRRLLRDIAEGRELGDVTTLRDPDVMAQLEGKIKERQADGESWSCGAGAAEAPAPAVRQTSTMTASPWPPPEQIAATPRPPPRRRSSWISVAEDARAARPRSGARGRSRRR